MGFDAFRERLGQVNDVLSASNLLVWDSRTKMPPGGVASRGRQIATLTVLARQLLVADETRHLLDAAEREVRHEPETSAARRSVAQTRAAIDHHLRVPEALERRRAELRTVAQEVWIDARAARDFRRFEPLLSETFELARQLADAIGYVDHPYDAMLSVFEPGATVASLDALFAGLRAGILPLLRQAPPPRGVDILTRNYPEAGQRAFGLRVAERFGYDLARGRLDRTVHPFEISFTRDDVRITTVFDPNNVATALRGVMHEAGHGIYEQGVDPAHTRSPLATDLVGLYAAGGASFGAHESQSRLWENHVGRSSRFWELNFGELRDTFPEALAGVEAEDFRAAYNSVRPGPIRTQADELTYDLHIMLRVELERSLMDGSLRARDLPEAWNAAMLRDLGVRVSDDGLGVLQDIHWAVGYVGSFCTYTVGNVMAAQLYAAALAQDPSIAPGLDRGDYGPLRAWLTAAVYQHGRRFSRDELLERATGRALDPSDYLAYLGRRYATTESRP